jgi:hypothetical protein
MRIVDRARHGIPSFTGVIDTHWAGDMNGNVPELE